MATVLITGSSGGIGKAAALRLASRGHHVIASGRNAAGLEQLRRSAKGRLDTVVADVASAASVDASRNEIEALTGSSGLDVLINNAGYTVAGPLESVSEA